MRECVSTNIHGSKYIALGYIDVNSVAHVARGIANSYKDRMKSIVEIRLENFRHLLRQYKQAEIARRMGRSPGQIQQWAARAAGRNVKGSRNIDDVSARLLEESLGLERNWMDQDHFSATARIVEPLALSGPVPVGLYHAEEPLADGEVEIPAVNVLVGAGNRIHTEQVQEERRFRYSLDWIQRYGLKPDKLVRYRVRGTSMDPFISDGSWITVEMGYAQVNDGGTYLLRYGDQISVKFLFRRYDGGLILRSFNPSEPDVVVPAQDLEHVDVLGRVVESTNMLIKPIK